MDNETVEICENCHELPAMFNTDDNVPLCGDYWADGLDDMAQHEDDCPCSGDTVEHSSDCANCTCDLKGRIETMRFEYKKSKHSTELDARAYSEQLSKITDAGWELAEKFHDAYESLAPIFGYKTREESAKPWPEIPLRNRQLMAATCTEILASRLAAGEQENERLSRWKKLIEDTPEEGRELSIERMLATEAMRPIIGEWKKKLAADDERATQAEKELAAIKQVASWRTLEKGSVVRCVTQRSERAESLLAEAGEALKLASEKIWEHHEMGHIRREFEKGAGPCGICGNSGIFERIDKLLARLGNAAGRPTQATADNSAREKGER